MSILNVNQIQPVGSGQTVTISATNIDTGSATLTAGTFTGNLTGNVTGNVSGIITSSSGNLTLTNGNLVFSTSGTGIDFSATSDAGGMTSELLDDYEEGSWTPDVSGGGVSWNNRSGSYVKIGKQVIAQFWLQASSTSSTSGTFSINGLPYTSGVYNDRPCGACRAYSLANFTGKSGVLYWMSGNVAYVNIVAVDGNGLTEGTSLNHNVWQNGAEIHCSIQYQTA